MNREYTAAGEAAAGEAAPGAAAPGNGTARPDARFARVGGVRIARTLASTLALAVFQLTLYGGAPSLVFAQGAGEAATAPESGRRAALLLVPRRSEDSEAATVLQSLFRQSLGRLVGIEVASLAPVRSPEKAAQAARAARQGEEALQLDPALAPDLAERARGHFRQAADLLHGAPGAGDVRLRAWAHKGLGVAAALAGDRDQARVEMRRSLLLVPSQTSAEYGYAAAASERFEAVQREMAAEATGSIEVTSEPAGAEVLTGGELKGYAPISITNLSPGEHWVEVRRDGHFVWGAFVPVTSGEATAREAVLTSAPALASLDGARERLVQKFDKARAGEVAALVKGATRATDVIVGRASLDRSGRFQVDGFHATRDGQLVPVAVQIERDASLIANIQSFLGSLLDTAPAPELPPGPISAPIARAPVGVVDADDGVIDPNSPLFKKVGAEEERITEKWWFWTLIGVGVAGTALAIALPLALSKEEAGGGPRGGLSIGLGGLQ